MPARGKARVPSEVELKRLFSVTRAGPHALRNVAMLMTSYKLGLRAKEIATLTIRDVLDEQGRLREECSLSAACTKGGKPRIAFLTNPTVRAALKSYLDKRRELEGILFNLEAALFKTQRGSSFSPNTCQQMFHKLHERAGIVGGRSHSGRRFFATTLISKGVDLKAVATLMGHSSVSLTASYAQDCPQRLRLIVAELL